jgi:hypothetical protein
MRVIYRVVAMGDYRAVAMGEFSGQSCMERYSTRNDENATADPSAAPQRLSVLSSIVYGWGGEKRVMEKMKTMKPFPSFPQPRLRLRRV